MLGVERRRRQLSNLESISEAADLNPRPAANGPSSSPEELSQTNPDLVREVLATMAIGGELGINFRPDDDRVLHKMIELELQEVSLARERAPSS